tara:strand:+ start:1484 stop:2608 length:1125 start_codon:yes stop_codon:yes gene_type:complete
MALTKTPIELSSTPSIVDGGNATAITIDSSENVGIGTGTPGSYYAGAEQLVIARSSGEAGITIATANDTNGALYFADGTSGAETYQGGIGYQHATSKLFLVESGVATCFFGPTEYVFNETSLDRDFRVESNGNANMLFVDGGNNSVMIGGTALASGQRFAVNVINADSSTNEPVVFNNETHSAANAYGILIKYSGSSGNWSSGTGQNFIRCTDDGESNQKFAVTGAGQVQAQTGIAFGGDTATANTLDDYEEGTWTPSLTGNSSATFSVRNGRYTKVGNLVRARCAIKLSGWTSNGTEVEVTGLPYATVASGYDHDWGAVHLSSKPTDHVVVCGVTGSKVFFRRQDISNADNGVVGGHIDADTGIMFSVVYQTT